MKFPLYLNINHFGVKLRQKVDGHELTRENYCKIDNKSSLTKDKIYSDEWCQKHYSNCMENFDLNMKYFECLDKNEFDKSILDFTKKYPFKEIKNLNDYDNVPGYYLLVLDHYKQAYLGTTNNLKKRITSHWSKTKKFDRLLFPVNNINSSILSIDSFRALDTTRIYINHDKVTFEKEDLYINSFNPMFLSNRIGGGLIENGLLGFIQVLTTKKTRNMK